MPNQDYIPKQENTLNTWLENIVVKLPAYAHKYGLDVLDTNTPYGGTVETGAIVLALYGRFPDDVLFRINNSGTVPLNIGITILGDGPLIVPITNLAGGASIDIDILTMGGQGRPYLRIENPSATTDGSYTIYTTFLGQMINAADDTIRSINLTNELLQRYHDQVDAKDQAKEANIGLLRDGFQGMKKNSEYDTNDGENLDIIAVKPVVDIANSKPELSQSKVPTGWAIGYNLLGFFDGITINRKRPSDSNFSFWRQRTTAKSVIDTEPMVNGTQYQAYFMIGDDLVGQPSDPLVISL